MGTYFERLAAWDVNVEEVDFAVLRHHLAWKLVLARKAPTIRVVGGERVVDVVGSIFDLGN